MVTSSGFLSQNLLNPVRATGDIIKLFLQTEIVPRKVSCSYLFYLVFPGNTAVGRGKSKARLNFFSISLKPCWEPLDSPHRCCVGLTSHTIIVCFNQFMLTLSKTACDSASVSSCAISLELVL